MHHFPMVSNLWIKRILYSCFLYCLLFLTLLSCDKELPINKIIAVNGILDLRDRDTEKKGPLSLDGQWEFYRDRLLEPRDFADKNIKDRGIIEVPGLWKGRKVNGAELNGEGYGTYRLTIIGGDYKRISALTISGILTAYRLWINSEEIHHRGIVDTSAAAREQFVFIHHETIVPFTLRSGANEIILQVLNYHFKSGGIKNPLILGDAEAVLQNQLQKDTINILVVSLLFFISIYNLLLYYFRKKDQAPLYLGFFSLIWTIYLFNLLLPFINNYSTYPRISYLTDYLTVVINVPFCLMTMKALYPDDCSTPATRLSQVLAVLFMIPLLFTGFKSSEQIMDIYYNICIVFIIYCIYVFIRIVYNRRKDSLLFFTGFISYFLVSLNDLLHTLEVINTALVSQYGMLLFCFINTIVISRRFARAQREVEELSNDLEEKNRALVKSDMLKDQFLAATSHELRTPLHGMIGLSESLIDGVTGDLPPKAVENLSLIASSGHRLAAMVNDLLDMAGIQDRGLSLNLRPLDLRVLAGTVILLSVPLIKGRPVKIISTIGHIPKAWADEDRIKQVLHNLVGNAIKFTGSGTVEISADVIVPPSGENGAAGRMIEVRVSDTGIGIPEEDREVIFEPYRQLDGGDSRMYPGAGLGLAIAKQIVRLHNGDIRVMPGSVYGSVFAFTLPVAPEPAEYDHNAVTEAAGAETQFMENPVNLSRIPAAMEGISFDNNPLLLVVDDDPVNVRVLSNYLESKGCTVKTAADGVTALDIIGRDKSVDLVLLDIMMPGMSGFEVCKRVRASRKPDDLPVIMLTAKNMIADINAAFEAGANDYIVKPFQVSELLARVSTMLKLKNIRRSAADSVSLRAGDNTFTLKFNEIVYITSRDKNIIVHTMERDMEIPVMMKDIIGRLPADIFIRVHKSYIININYVLNLHHVVSGRYRVKLKDSDDTELPVGPTFLDPLRKKINK